VSAFDYATVAAVAPLKIVMDADPVTQIPALVLSTYTPTVGDRVRVEVRRSGLAPIVQGRVS
jgi:hypothetical protein